MLKIILSDARVELEHVLWPEILQSVIRSRKFEAFKCLINDLRVDPQEALLPVMKAGCPQMLSLLLDNPRVEPHVIQAYTGEDYFEDNIREMVRILIAHPRISKGVQDYLIKNI